MIWALFSILIPLLLIDLFMPHVLRKTTVFGISIPEPFVNDDVLAAFKKKYSMLILCIQTPLIILLFALAFPFDELKQSLILVMGLHVYLVISLLIYLSLHRQVKQYKAEKGWEEQVRIVRVSKFESKFDKQARLFPHIFFIPSFFITVGLTIWLTYIYPLLPDVIPTHWGANGQPDAWSDKSIFSVFMIIFIMFFMQILMYGIAYGVFHSAVNIKASNSELSYRREHEMRKLNANMLAILNVGTTLFMGFLLFQSYWGVIYGDSTVSSMIFALPIFLLITFVSIYYYMTQSKKLNEQFKEANPHESTPGDDEHWKWGIFYFNKDNPDAFIEKKFGVGWTINFARPGAWIFILIVVFVPLIPLFFI